MRKLPFGCFPFPLSFIMTVCLHVLLRKSQNSKTWKVLICLVCILVHLCVDFRKDWRMEFVALLKFAETSQPGSSCPPDQIEFSGFQ